MDISATEDALETLVVLAKNGNFNSIGNHFTRQGPTYIIVFDENFEFASCNCLPAPDFDRTILCHFSCDPMDC